MKLSQTFFILVLCVLLILGCWKWGGKDTLEPDPSTPQGTETGNPKIYNQGDFRVTVEYPSGWLVIERDSSNAGEPIKNPTTGEEIASGSLSEEYLGSDTLGVHEVSSTVLTDGQSTAIIYYLTLEEAPDNLLEHLQSLFDKKLGVLTSHAFPKFENSHLSGFEYPNPKLGTRGGDLREYFFLKGKTFLYVAAEIQQKQSAQAEFDQIINSIRFE